MWAIFLILRSEEIKKLIKDARRHCGIKLEADEEKLAEMGSEIYKRTSCFTIR